jgi:Streptomyces sporulation and cell division protein, SsgA
MSISHVENREFSQPVLVDLCSIDGTISRILVDLAFDASDPYAVGVVFRTTGGPVRWTFARELLSDGLCEPAGDGDVHVWPCLDDCGLPVVVVELCSRSGDALVQLRAHDVVSFVDRTHVAVPVGEEHTHLDMDALIASIRSADCL